VLLAVPAFALAVRRAVAALDQPGPKLPIAASKLRLSFRCTGRLRHARREPVLLLAATGVTSEQNFSWNYERALRRLGIPYCTSDVPGRFAVANLGSLVVRGYYVTYAMRRMYALAGRRIATLGHSQGGMIMRWSLRFWPDTRRMVDKVIGLEGDNQGGLAGNGTCPRGCAVAYAQQEYHSRFIEALNSRQQTFRGISYTEIYSTDDTGSSGPGPIAVHGPGRISNVSVQSVCPGHHVVHVVLGTLDPVAYALALFTLEHSRPARASDISRSVCADTLQPGVDPATVGRDATAALNAETSQTQAAPKVYREPPLPAFVFARSWHARSSGRSSS
jgi:hypothetical protein